MNNITYLIFTHNESRTYLDPLFTELTSPIKRDVIIVDDFSTNQETLECLASCSFEVHKHSLNNDFASHKNYGNSLCNGQWILQLDGDELLTKHALHQYEAIVHDLMQTKSDIELINLPRVNQIVGLTEEATKMYGWRVSHENIINWPDYQTRLYRNLPHIKWEGRLHERVVGARVIADADIPILHTKTLTRQLEQNNFYNNTFTQQENMGVRV